MTRRRGKPSRPGGLWPLSPATCFARSLLVAGLATAAALTWTQLGLALTIPLTAAALLIFALTHLSAARPGAAPR